MIAQSTFAPRYGFDFQNDMIGHYTTNGALAYGKMVTTSAGVLALANDVDMFLMNEVTTDGPSIAELAMGDYQMMEVKVGYPVSCLISRKGNVVRTIHVAQGDNGAAAPAAGQYCNVASGVFVTVAANAGTKALIQAVVTDSNGTTLYDVQIL